MGDVGDKVAKRVVLKRTLKGLVGPARDAYRELRLPNELKELREADRRGLPPTDPGPEALLSSQLQWLRDAQSGSITHDGGFARDFNLAEGWARSYPETTGYIIPTLLDARVLKRRPETEEWARQALDWLVGIQHHTGGFQGGVVGGNSEPVTFNTGQILMGLAAGTRHFGESYVAPLHRAAQWLAAIQDESGAWKRYLTTFASPGPKTYETHTAWGLLEAGIATGENRYTEAALRQVDWALDLQRDNGWFDRCCLTDFKKPLTHTMAYTMRGVLEAYQVSEEPRYLKAAQRMSEPLLEQLSIDGFLAGRYSSDWKPAVRWSCLTGTSQFAICWGMLYEMTGDKQYLGAHKRANSYVRRTVRLHDAEPGRRGIAGSFPIDGEYGKFQMLNWASKFTIDANLMELELS